MNVYLQGNITDMQGPCAEGFHVPLKSEWTGLISIMVGLGYPNNNGDNWKSLLHFPYTGMRGYTNKIGSQGTYGYYWASTPAGSPYTTRVDTLQIGSSIVSDAISFRGNAISIRAFKDEFVVPTSGWTVIAGTLGSGGIFWNTTDGIISITGDGSTGYTIKDKNEGATLVYNSGDTLSQNNCGKYYQFGNNYGFAWTGSVTTSSTQVNASSYGPGNYYSSSTFITGNQDWSSVQNDNLRGGVSQGSTTKNVELKNIYIGELQFATRGPCPRGYHIPLQSEMEGLFNVGVTLGAWSKNSSSTQTGTYLHLPPSGWRSYANAGQNLGYGKYWTSSAASSNSEYGYALENSNSNAGVRSEFKANAFSIRPFKNIPIIPDSSWTKTYSGTGTAGIYYNSTKGLISISADGTTWYTISDKNLGAYIVYNNGDTMSYANCGYYYQRGNNNPFQWSGTISSTATQVNASNYGPGNYYTGGFIKRPSSPYNRDSSNNPNLWGGVDGNVPVE